MIGCSIYRLAFALALAVQAVHGAHCTFTTPSADRWHYPFNFTPGSRSVASVFGATAEPGFNDRDGCMVIAWNTSASIAAGEGTDGYGVRSLRVTLINQKTATWPIDTTVDAWFTCDLNGDDLLNGDGIPRGELGDTDGESSDLDPGRPIELFGAGFGPTFTAASWNENSIYVGSDSIQELPRDPFPFVFGMNDNELLHVEDSVKGLHNTALNVANFTPQPWGIGVPSGYTPGAQSVAFPVTFDVDLTLSEGRTHRYFRERLNAGRLFVIITSLRETTIMGAANGYPGFFTKEGVGQEPGALAPRLDLDACRTVGPDLDFDCDVDTDDLAVLEACATGPALGPPSAACARSDFNQDGDVDMQDFACWQRCLSGAGEDPEIHCAD